MGAGDQIDYGMRVYDPRAGRFMSVDPLTKSYPWNSAYAYAEDEPISNVDLDGLEKVKSTFWLKTIFNTVKQDVKDDAHTFNNQVRTAIKTKTYVNLWHDVSTKVSTFASTAVNDPDRAADQFANGATNFSLHLGYGIANTVQEYTSHPVLWALTIPDRTRDENLADLGHGIYKGAKLYFTLEAGRLFPLSLEESSFSAVEKFTLKSTIKETQDLAFGLGDNLSEFSAATGFKNYRQFTSGGFQKEEIMAAITNPKNNIHFNLTGWSRTRYLRFNPSQPVTYYNITNWELHLIKTTPGALERTTFYEFKNGSYKVTKPPKL